VVESLKVTSFCVLIVVYHNSDRNKRKRPPIVITGSLNPAIALILEQLIRSPKTARDLIWRAEIWWYASAFPQLGTRALGQLVGRTPKTVRKHVGRLEQSLEALNGAVAHGGQAHLKRLVADCLQDAPRSGHPPTFSPAQIVSLISLACEQPELCGRPVSKWTSREIADEAVKRKIVEKISASHVGQILRSVNLKPHKIKGWCFTTEKDQEEFDRRAQEVCDAYLQAPQNHTQSGLHTVCVDEATGLQANEKRAASLPAKPDQPAKEETQYTRHGAVCLTAAWDVVLGAVVQHQVQETRTNEDFAWFIEQTTSSDPDGKWIFVLDNLNTHSGEALVRLIARLEGIDETTLGDKKKRRGILGSIQSRQAFLNDPERRIRFVYTPKHSSWLNQVEVIFGIVKRRGLAGASFKSTAELIARIDHFIAYYNTTFAQPMNWTYTGRPTDAKPNEQPLTWRQRLLPKSWKDHWHQHHQPLAA
jgi:transposase